jgi:PAS domain-containing protein
VTQSGYLLLGLTAIVGAVVGTVTFTLLRAFAAARDITGPGRARAGAETAFMAVAMEEAMSRLKLREQALAERAEASERLSDEIITSLASGLLVVGPDHRVQAFNPFGRRLLQLPDSGWTGDVTDVLRTAQPLAARCAAARCKSTPTPSGRRISVSPSPRSAAGKGSRAARFACSAI